MKRRERPEQQIQGAVFEHLKARGAPGLFAWHPFSGGYRRPIEAAIYTRLGARPGLPDVMILHQGRLFCLELKADTGRLTDIQRNTIESMQAAGVPVAVCHGLDSALRWLEANALLRGRAALDGVTT